MEVSPSDCALASTPNLSFNPLKILGSTSTAIEIRQVDPSLGFLDLPREIRDQIYDLLFRSESPVYPSKSRAGISPYTNLLGTSKQIYSEAVEILYASNTFQIRGDPAWNSVGFLNLLGTQTRNGYSALKRQSQVCFGRHHLKRLYIPSHGISLDRLKHIFSLLKYFPNLEYLQVIYIGLSPKLDMEVVNVCRLFRDRRPLFADPGVRNFVLSKRINYYQAEDVSWMVKERPAKNWTRIVGDTNRLHAWRNSDDVERFAMVVDAPQNIPE